MSHRGKDFTSIIQKTEADFRSLLGVGEEYDVTFLQGGGTGMFAGVPMNLSGGSSGTPAYLSTGTWTIKAIKEAKKYCSPATVASIDLKEDASAKSFLDRASWSLPSSAPYFYYCANETIGGLEVSRDHIGNLGETPVVCDMSSNIMSRPVDVSKFGAIYAGAQKNMGPAGLTVLVLRKDLKGKAMPITPSVMDWTVMGDAKSVLNTPPTYAIYMAGLVYDWVKEHGGVAGMEEASKRKSALLYNALDKSDFYSTIVPEATGLRSRMNVTFTTPSADLDAKFVAEATAKGMIALKGHRTVGGLRASLYNAVSEDSVAALVDFMTAFEQQNSQ